MNAKPTMIVRQTKFIVFAVLILALSALSFFETIDQLAHEKVSETTLETTGIFAVLKVIDLGVSVLQTTEIGVGINIEVGQALDPLNKMVEHLSVVVAWAIGSLFLQQVVLQIVTNDFFKYVFLTFGFITFLTLFLHSSQYCQAFICKVFGISKNSIDLVCTWVVKLFFTTAVVRFIVPIFALCSFLFSEALVQSDLNKHKAHITEFSNQNQFDTVTSIPSPSELAEQEQSIKSELSTLQSQLPSHQLDLDVVEENLNALSGESFLRRLIPGDDVSKSYDPEVDDFIVQRQDVRQKIENTNERIAELERDLKCISRQKEGKSCESLMVSLDPKEAVSRTMEVGTRIIEMASDDRQVSTDTSIPPQSVLMEQEQNLNAELNSLQSELSNYRHELDAVKWNLIELSGEEGLSKFIPGSNSKSSNPEVGKFETQRQEIQQKIDIAKEQIADLERDLKCIGRQKEGKTCDSLLDRLELKEAVSRTKEVGSQILEMVNDEIQKGTDLPIPPQSVLVEREQVKQSELNTLQSELSNYQLEWDAVDSKFSDLNKKLKAQRQEIQRKIGIAKERISDLEDDLKCIERQKEGENCISIWEKTKEVASQIKQVAKAAAGGVIDSMIRVLTAVFVKNILFPLIFAYLAMKFSIPIIRKVMDLKADFQKTAKDVSTELQR